MKTISILELCFRLGQKERWVMDNCIHVDDPIPHAGIGSALFFDPEKVDEWFQNRMCGSTNTGIDR